MMWRMYNRCEDGRKKLGETKIKMVLNGSSWGHKQLVKEKLHKCTKLIIEEKDFSRKQCQHQCETEVNSFYHHIQGANAIQREASRNTGSSAPRV